MGAMSTSMFLGITLLARALHVRVSEDVHGLKSVLAQIGETVYDGGWPFFVLQGFTAGILILAANTAYQDFPRLAAILARDRFMPSQFRNRGDRLVFSNGVIVLAGFALLLIYVFDANLTRLIQLYVVGVFTAFTLSQTGMVLRWFRLREGNWVRSAIINGIGATTTGVVLVIVTLTKFTRGAWIVIVAMPVIIAFFLSVNRYYAKIGRILRARNLTGDVEATNTFVFVVRDLETATLDAVSYLRSLRPERVRPVYVGAPERFDETRDVWATTAPRLGELELLEGADTKLVRSLKAYLARIERGPDDFVTVVIPEELSGRSWLQFARDRFALRLKTRLLFQPGIVVTDVPLVPEEVEIASAHRDRPVEPERSVVLVPISSVHDATVRAVIYAKALRPAEIEAVVFVSDPEESAGLIDEWHRRRLDIPLSMIEAPFRDLDEPMLAEVRKHSQNGDTIVTVVLPEFVPGHWWQQLLHNQTAFAFKRLLLFEPNVVVTSVPFHIRDEDRG
jgi:hypothetical protein